MGEGEGQVTTALPVNHENNELILRLFAKYAGVEDGVPLPDSCRIEHSKYVSIGVQNPIWDQLQKYGDFDNDGVIEFLEFKTACCLNALREHFDPLPKTPGFDQIKHWFVFFNKKLNDELLSHVHLLRDHSVIASLDDLPPLNTPARNLMCLYLTSCAYKRPGSEPFERRIQDKQAEKLVDT